MVYPRSVRLPEPVPNPFAPPRGPDDEAALDLGPEVASELAPRLRFKANGIRFVASMWLVASLVAAAVTLTAIPSAIGERERGIFAGVAALSLAVFGASVAVLALRPWSRWLAMLFAVLGMRGFPVGTAVGLWMLYQLLSSDGQLIFSNRYRQILARADEQNREEERRVCADDDAKTKLAEELKDLD